MTHSYLHPSSSKSVVIVEYYYQPKQQSESERLRGKANLGKMEKTTVLEFVPEKRWTRYSRPEKY
jgi:hypothetical protein